MQNPRSRSETYRAFLAAVSGDIQKERARANRRFFGVFFWCFLAPAVTTLGLMLAVRGGFIAHRWRALCDWLVLIFPIGYSLFVLGFEVLRDVPTAFRRGGLVNTLKQSGQEGDWRAQQTEALVAQVGADPGDWEWITASYRIDLAAFLGRTRYLTALSGAVFFLIFRGIDWLSDPGASRMVRNPLLSPYVQVTGFDDQAMTLTLAIFLVLLYLSGTQTHRALSRYLDCAELALLKSRAARS